MQIPADGEYYIKVEDCNSFFNSGCPTDPADITNFEYNLFVGKVDTIETNAGTMQARECEKVPW